MSLYNMFFGVNKCAPLLLHAIWLDPSDIPRFRDCFLHEGNIVVHTRTGGGNREWYQEPNEDNLEGPWNTNLTGNPFYLRDEDDDFDSTFANFYFRLPEDYAEDLKAIEAQVETHMPSEKWQALFKAFDEGKK